MLHASCVAVNCDNSRDVIIISFGIPFRIVTNKREMLFQFQVQMCYRYLHTPVYLMCLYCRNKFSVVKVTDITLRKK